VRRHWWMKGLAFLVFAPAVLALLSVMVMLLWNALIPSLFSGPVLGFWQAVGLLILCRILFGGLRGRGGHGGWRHQHAWRDRWHRMTPEERDRFRESFRRWRQMSREERRQFRRRFRGCGPGFAGNARPDFSGPDNTDNRGPEVAPREGGAK
jgi:hypothetical protein